MGKALMAMAMMLFFVCIGGSIAQGSAGMVATTLTADISDSDTTIPVTSTTGFPDTGIIVIGDEHIGYADTSTTQFEGNLASPTLRGTNNTTESAHTAGAIVRTKSAAMMNTATDYYIAVLADSAGLQAFIAMPNALFRIIGSFLVSPFGFLGTDFELLTYLWAVLGLGVLVALVISLAGGRRV